MSITVGLVLVGLALLVGVLSNWIDKPDWLPTWGVLVLLVSAAVGAFVITNRAELFRNDGGSADAGDPSPSESGIPSAVRSKMLLTYDDSSDRIVMFASHVDGTNRQKVWSDPSDVNHVKFIPESTDLVVANTDEGSHQNYLEVVSLTGEFIRRLTYPPRGFTDTHYTVVGQSGYVYFTRQRVVPAGEDTSVIKPYKVMRVPLNRRSPEEDVSIPLVLRTISASDDGKWIVGECYPTDGPTKMCIYNTATKSMNQVPKFGGYGLEVTISRSGRYIAFSSTADNPYGESQVYVFDRQKSETTQISKLPGRNGHPLWSPDTEMPCLTFDHYETSEQSVYVACLKPKVQVFKALTNAHGVAWFLN
ncbi:TolB family protein [Kribbella sp. CA-253562]|uniref:TolB family protein n=1 Tax=Kribbella sp. CA-253562 TaxID=3239942 RepID=UPI003D943479